MRITNRTDIYLAQQARERRGREEAGCRLRYVYRDITSAPLDWRNPNEPIVKNNIRQNLGREI